MQTTHVDFQSFAVDFCYNLKYVNMPDNVIEILLDVLPAFDNREADAIGGCRLCDIQSLLI